MHGSPLDSMQSVALYTYEYIARCFFNKAVAKVEPSRHLSLSLLKCGNMDEHLWQLRDNFEGLNSYEVSGRGFKFCMHVHS